MDENRAVGVLRAVALNSHIGTKRLSSDAEMSQKSVATIFFTCIICNYSLLIITFLINRLFKLHILDLR